MRTRIDAARLVCVLMMMYVHVPNGHASSIVSDPGAYTRFDHWLESILIEGPGRASAALLSVVSGYLAATTLLQGRLPVTRLYWRRFCSVVLPMFCWALLTCLIYLALGQSDALLLTPGSDWLDKLNKLLFLTSAPEGPTLHLGFLRDLFVCVLLSPVLLWLLKRLPLVTMTGLLAVYLFHHSGQLVIILRPLVIFGFAIGIMLALRRTTLHILDPYWAWFLSLAGVFAMFIIWADAGMFLPVQEYLAMRGISFKETILYPLCRLFGSLAIWTMLSTVHMKTLLRITSRYSDYVFAAFCAHFLILTLVFNGFWAPLFGGRDAYIYLLWFIAAPAVSLLLTIFFVNLVSMLNPQLASLITGGRLSLSAGSGSPVRPVISGAST